MVTVEHFDLLVFGGGKAGKTLAMDQAKAGRRVAMIEVGMIGGSCINIACIPSKALIRSAEITNFVAHADDFGTTVEGARLTWSAWPRERQKSYRKWSTSIKWPLMRAALISLSVGGGLSSRG